MKKAALSAGRIRPLILGLLILVSGFWIDQWWWSIGLVIIIVIFLEAAAKYSTLD